MQLDAADTTADDTVHPGTARGESAAEAVPAQDAAPAAAEAERPALISEAPVVADTGFDLPGEVEQPELISETPVVADMGADLADEASPVPAVEAAAPDEAETPTADFASLGLSEDVVRAVEELGYRTPTPIQAQAIPIVLMGRDVLGVAQTGTGKTAGFTLPMLDILAGSRARARMPRSLILEPTRELALQVAESFVRYGKHLKLTHALLIGGESMSEQKEALMRGVDVLIATPGRLIDLFERGGLLLTDARLLVIDEADRMLDMGFIPDVERIVAMLPRTRQTLFFSATMAPEIRRLADAFLQNPREVTVSRAASVAPTIVAGLTLVAEHDKREALRRLVRRDQVQNALIFCNRKRDVDTLWKSLKRHEFSAGALHGDMSQPERFATLGKFKAGEIRLLVCSDVAARGLDIGGLSHVFNFDVPIHPEDYVHRIGRTGRAGLTGHAYTLATPYEQRAVEAIEKLIGSAIPRLQIEALDPVDWAPDDERPRRGRGRAAPAERSRSGRSPSAEGRKPSRTAADRPSERQDRPEGRAPESRVPEARVVDLDDATVERPRSRRPARDAGEAGTERVARGRGRAEEAREPAPRREPAGDRPARRDEAREGGRGDRDGGRFVSGAPYNERPRRRDRRDDDLGPSVVGFGDDVPAFMLLRTRRAAGSAGAVAPVEAG